MLESPEIGIIGAGEGTFPTIRQHAALHRHRRGPVHPRDVQGHVQAGHPLRQLGARAGRTARDDHYHSTRSRRRFHDRGRKPGALSWLLQDERTRPSFAGATTIQNREAERRRAPKKPGRGDGQAAQLSPTSASTPRGLAEVLAEHARMLGVAHLQGPADRGRAEPWRPAHRPRGHARRHGHLEADLYIDCSGFRAELISRALGVLFKPVGDVLFTDRALRLKPAPRQGRNAPLPELSTCRLPRMRRVDLGYRPRRGARGIGCVLFARRT